MTGLGGGVMVAAPVVSGPPFCASLICVPSRPFGAGFGTGTFCADDGVTAAKVNVAITSANPACLPRMRHGPLIRDSGFGFNAQSYLAPSHFNAVSVRCGIVFA
jgi:hypothetical protein